MTHCRYHTQFIGTLTTNTSQITTTYSCNSQSPQLVTARHHLPSQPQERQPLNGIFVLIEDKMLLRFALKSEDQYQ